MHPILLLGAINNRGALSHKSISPLFIYTEVLGDRIILLGDRIILLGNKDEG